MTNFVQCNLVPRQRVISSVERRKSVASVGGKRQRVDTDHGGDIERAVEMWKQRAAARGLPFERRAEALGVDVQQQEIALAGEMLRRGLGHLMRGREMNEAVFEIDR